MTQKTSFLILHYNWIYMKNKLILLYIFFFVISVNTFAKVEKISLQLQWMDQFQFAGYYMAKEKGFYEDVSLDVNIKKFKKNLNIVNEVISNRAQYGIGRSSLIIDRSNGKKVVALAAIFQSSPLIFITLETSKIQNISDFRNKRIMITDDSLGTTSLKAMLLSQGIKFDDTIIQKHSYDLNDLISQKTDIMAAYISNQPFLLDQKNIKYKVFSPSDYGFNFYNDFLFTNQNELHNHPLRVKKFLKASLKGWNYAFNNINESVDIIYNNYNSQNKSKQALRYEALTLKKLAFQGTNSLGKISENKLNRIYDIHTLMGLTNQNINLDEFIYSSTKLHLSSKEKLILKQLGKITVHNEINWPPYNFNENGIPKGYSIDFMNLLAKKIGVSIEYISNKSWEEYLFMLKNKDIDVMLNIVNMQERREFINFTSSYSKLLPAIFTLKNKRKFKNIHDFDGKTIAVPKGFYSHALLKKLYPKIKIKETKNILEALQAVAFKKADAAISDFSVANFLLEKYAINNLEAVINIIDDNFQKNLSIGTRKDLPQLKDILQKAINSVTDEEQLKLRRKWFGHKIETLNKQVNFSEIEKKFLQKISEVKICVDPYWSPFESIEEGKYIGMIADYMNYFSKLLNVPFHLVETSSWQESLDFIKDKKCDILPSAAFTYERLRYLNFTKPYIFSPFVIATTNDKSFIENFEQVASKPIGMVKGYSSIDIFTNKYPNIKIIEYNSVTKALESVRRKEIFGVIDTAATIGYSINKNKLHDLKIAGKLDETWEIGIAVRNDYPILLSILQKTIDTLTTKERDRIYNNWITVKFEEGINYNSFFRIGIPIISILIIIIFYLWNIKLKKEIKNKRHLEKKLKASINDFKMLVNSTLEAIFIFDKNGYCIEANNEAIKLFNFNDPSEILGEHVLRLIDENSRADAIVNLRGRKGEPYEANLIKKDKVIFPGLIKSIHSTRGHKYIKIISIIDLSDLKEKESLLFQQSKMALMGEMMSAIAHQWRQPLNTIAALNLKVETLLEFNETINNQQYSVVSKEIETQLNYMSKTIDDFRDFFVPNKRKVNFSISKAIKDVYDMLSPQFKTYDILVTLDTQSIVVCGYPNEFKQVLINIINNSKDAILSKKRKSKFIHIKAEKDIEKKALISISDNGGGIDEEIISKIYDPYFTTKFKSQGTGIGLYMSKMIIEKSMSGKLSVSNSKEGVIFEILI